MADVTIYTTNFCPYCMGAKSLLEAKGVTWTEINLDNEPNRREEMMEKSEGRRTVPQIFVDGQGLGGYDDIAALDRAGELDSILQAG